jgi:hypothetical protein
MNNLTLKKLIRFFSIFLLSLSPVLFLGGCPTSAAEDSEDEDSSRLEETIDLENGVYTLTFQVPEGEVRYLNLNTAEWVTGSAAIASPDWDIAFHASRRIYTNSGDTATDLDSGGYGGVWFTNTTDFDAVSSEDDKATVDTANPDFNYELYFQDVKRHVVIMGVTYYNCLNVMSYAGYPDEDTYNGLTLDKALAGNGALVSYDYNKKQYYINPPMPDGGLRMPPQFEATGQVYIIRHGNAADFSKLQISWFQRYGVLEDRYTVQWKTF